MQKNLIFAVLFIVIISTGGMTLHTASSHAAFQSEGPLTGKVVYFTEENGEAIRFDRSARGLSRYAGVVTQLGATTQTLEWNSGVPADADLLVIASPSNTLSPDQVARLWLYINNGGRALLVADALEYRNEAIARTSRGFEAQRGLFELIWPDFGIRPEDNVVVLETDDPAESLAPTGEEIVDNPAMLTIDLTTENVNEDAEIMDDIEGPLYLSGARTVSLDATTPNLVVEPLFFSEGDYYGETRFDDYLNEGVAVFSTQEDALRGGLPLAVSLEDLDNGARMVLLGDVDLINNSGGFQSSPSYSSAFVYPANVQFAAQMTTWLLEEEAPTLSFPDADPTATPTMVPSPTPEATEEASSDN